jgi:hypothetical protein
MCKSHASVFFYNHNISFFFLCPLLWFVKYNFQFEWAHPQVLFKDGNESSSGQVEQKSVSDCTHKVYLNSSAIAPTGAILNPHSSVSFYSVYTFK